MSADAVVNPSNPRLQLGGGVSLALRLAAGPRLQPAMTSLAPLLRHEIAETSSFDHARVRAILHVPTASGDPETISLAYANVLRVARERGYRRVALPSLGTGTGGLSPQRGAELLRAELDRAAGGPPLTLVLALLDATVFDVFADVLGAS